MIYAQVQWTPINALNRNMTNDYSWSKIEERKLYPWESRLSWQSHNTAGWAASLSGTIRILSSNILSQKYLGVKSKLRTGNIFCDVRFFLLIFRSYRSIQSIEVVRNHSDSFNENYASLKSFIWYSGMRNWKWEELRSVKTLLDDFCGLSSRSLSCLKYSSQDVTTSTNRRRHSLIKSHYRSSIDVGERQHQDSMPCVL